MHMPESQCSCMQHSIYNVQQQNDYVERSVVEKKMCMPLCRSKFSDQPKTRACLYVREALSVSVGRGRGLVITVCMCREARAVQGGLEGSQMEIARPNEKLAIVWSFSPSL